MHFTTRIVSSTQHEVLYLTALCWTMQPQEGARDLQQKNEAQQAKYDKRGTLVCI